MTIARFELAVVLATALGGSAQAATVEELTTATFPHQHRANTVLFKWIGEALNGSSGGMLAMNLVAAGQSATVPVRQYEHRKVGQPIEFRSS